MKRFLSLCIFIMYTLLGNHMLSAQETKQQIIESTFKLDKECYFSFPLESKSKLQKLFKYISIDKIEAQTVYAYSNRSGFEKFLNTDTKYTLLDHPHTGFLADMYNPNLKNSFAWDQYLTYSEYTTMMYNFAIDYPEICSVFSIGQTVEGRELLVAKISDNVTVSEQEPQFLYTGQIHGDEIVNHMLKLRLIDHLLSNYSTDDQATRLVDNIEIWINPLANPDGLYAAGDNTVSGATRFNANGIDLNRNYPDPKSGDHPDGNAWQIETQHFMALAESQNFTMSANSHSGSEVVNYPWDTWSILSADDDWWQFVSHEYADLAQLNSPSGYLEGFNDGITNGYAWYSIDGGRQDYMNYFHHCREVTLELSTEKMLSASSFPAWWDYNRQALLHYLEQVTYGFYGEITDFDSGEAIQAKVEIIDHDFDESYVESNALGYYFRPIKAGNYNLKFSADGYTSQTINNQSITDYNRKEINIILKKLNSGLDSEYLSELKITNPIRNQKISIHSPFLIQELKIYSILGQLVYQQVSLSKELEIDVQNLQNGIYILNLEFSNGSSLQRRIIKPD